MALPIAVVATISLAAFAPSSSQAAGISDKPLGHLCWGVDRSTGRRWTQASLKSAFRSGDDADLMSGQTAAKAWVDFGKTFHTVSRITIAGYLPGQPSFDQSVAAVREMKVLVPLALCARGSSPDLAAKCQRAASDGVFAWMQTYSAPTGQPIDESNLLPLLLATDLLEDTWTIPQKAAASVWLDAFLSSSDRYREAELKQTRDVTYGNFESWRLMLNLFAATAADKEQDEQRLQQLWHEQLALNVGQDGRTWDLRRRGSLHYQGYDLEPMLWVRLFVPWAFTSTEDTLVRSGVTYLQPYYQGSKTYTEFADPDPALGRQIAFDVARRQAGMQEFQLKNWNPEDARQMLHFAAAVYPSVRLWVLRDKSDAYPIMVRQIIALHSNHAGNCPISGTSTC